MIPFSNEKQPVNILSQFHNFKMSNSPIFRGGLTDPVRRNKSIPEIEPKLSKAKMAMTESSESTEKDSAIRFIIVSGISIVITQGIAWLVSNPGQYMLQKLAGISILIQWIVYIFQASGIVFGNKRSEKFYDLTGSITYFTLILISFFSIGWKKASLRQSILSTFVLIWCSRLGSFLFSRISKEGGIDSRFNGVREKFFRFWGFWTIQGLWVFLTALPVFTLNQIPMSHSNESLQAWTAMDVLGIAMWIIGFSMECIADFQKSEFKSIKSNHGKFINIGLWRYSRHPNYFGEICLWLGVFLSAANGFDRFEHWLCLLSPMFVTFLLMKVSGIPLLEKAGDKRWGADADYIYYKKTVPVLVPFIGPK